MNTDRPPPRKRESWTRIALANSTAHHSALLVLVILAEHADAYGLSRPSIGRIASLARVSPRQVSRDLVALIALNDLQLVEKGGGKRKPSTYRLTMSRVSPFNRPYHDIHERGITRHTMTPVSSYKAGIRPTAHTMTPMSPEVGKRGNGAHNHAP